MATLQTVFLSFLQAATEIFPFSYKAHLILFHQFFGTPNIYSFQDMASLGGIVFALGIYYAKDIFAMLREAPKLLLWPFQKNRTSFFVKYPYALLFSHLMISTVVTAALHFALQDAGKTLGRWPAGVGMMWFCMGMLLFMSRRLLNGSRNIYEMNHQDAFLIGLAQSLALFPGLSRIGVVLLTALVLGMERREAARYSFLLSVPYMLIALFCKMPEDVPIYGVESPALFAAFLTAAVTAFVFLVAAVRMIQRGQWYKTGYYPIGLGVFTIFHSLIKVVFK